MANSNSHPSKKSTGTWQVVVAVFIFVTSLIAAFYWGYKDIHFLVVNPELSDKGSDIFLKYLFIVVAVERAAAVFVSNYRNRKVADWTLRISRIKETLSDESQHLNVLKMVFEREIQVAQKVLDKQMVDLLIPPEDNADEYRAALLCIKHSYEFSLARHQSTCNRDVTFFVFISGIVLASLGLSILSDVMMNLTEICGIHGHLIRIADVLITGGLLGGGSAGLNFASTRFAELMKKN
ncbi:MULTISPECIES: hypothetical protein [unclassified Agarivorans]|uniref:hypothetical protein n=1 Tax=unclassified Agarivorans TaxID=2636026 RepID=UPI0026E426A2|nr:MULTISPECIES: hypothetical protein [unclassified Agarivorans]MDO6687050.1 hypothetical protein [Agarivorans sp. 3_MG-2023]MDO6713538.1 hypothetical protein [Agarivorans sp. 2_MG-2023]MDO6765199.1 hypothetical protein [Agarivorans sp. 1_MG-2023]